MKKKKDDQSPKMTGKTRENVPPARPEEAFGNLTEGKPKIAALLFAVLLLMGAVILGAYLLDIIPSTGPSNRVTGDVTVYFFFGTECPHCHDVKPYVESLREKYPGVSFRILEIWHDTTNNAFYELQNHKLGLKPVGVPQAIIGNISLVGKTEIREGLEPAILAQGGNLSGSSSLGAVAVYGTSGTANATIHLIYFYGNGCSHCEAVKPLIADLEARYPELRVEALEINDNSTNLEKFLAMPVPDRSMEELGIPGIFIGGNALFGETEVKNHLEEKILAEKEKIADGTATGPAAGTPAGSSGAVNAIYFYSDTCSHCENVKPVIAAVSARYPDLNLSQREINRNADNRELFNDMSSQYGITNPGVPAIFIGNGVLVGESQIRNRLETEIHAEQQRIAAGIPSNMTTPGTGPVPETPGLNLYIVIFAALVDSMNPCGLSVLVFLLISMAAAGSRRRILLAGGMYTAAMFLFHLLVGIGLFSALSLSGLTRPFSIIGGVIALLFGIITLADVLRNKETYLLSISDSRKGVLGTYIRKATLPAAFVLGVLAGILGFSCTGGIYISILGLIGRSMTLMTGLSWLVLYNIVFVLPLVLVTLLAAYGVSPERAERWRTENKRLVRVIIGLLMVALGLLILSGWFG